LRELIRRAEARCGARAAELRRAHGWLLEVARRLEPPPASVADPAASGARVRQRVEARLDEIDAALGAGEVPDWLRAPVAHVGVVLRRLGAGLYHCYDVPGLPRTNNEQERFYRRIKTGYRRTTGRRRADAFVVRVGGFAAYAAAASDEPEAMLLRRFGAVPAAAWRRERAALRATQERQATMRRFRLRRAAYLADLEARWEQLTEPP
jgi:hypothetical protein